MVALTLIVCLHASPAECRPESIDFQGSLMTCSLYGQAVAAEWAMTHPKWRIKRFTCAVGRTQSA